MNDADQLSHNKELLFTRSEADNWGMGDDLEDGRIQLPPIVTEEQLAGMSVEALIANYLHLQCTCVQLDGDNKVLTWELRESNDYLLRFAKVAQIAHYLNASDLDKVAELAVGELPQFLNCQFAAFYLFDNARKEYTLYHSTHPIQDGQAISEGDGHFLARLFSSREDPFLIEYIQGSYRVDSSGDTLTLFKATDQWHMLLGDTAMVFPLVTRRAGAEPLVLGGLVLGNPESRLTEKDAEVSMMFVDLLSSSLYNANLVRQLNRMATTDVLTGLYNRRYFLTELDKAITHTQRSSQPLSIAMLDIDHFKKVNDDFGHFCGDAVLREIATLLRESVRKNVDVPARYGGEEFIVIMPYTSLDQAQYFSERVRRVVEETPIVFENQTLRITCSIGVAEYFPGETSIRFIDRADAAMYRAKNNGRNQVAVLPVDDLTSSF